jgi:signal transduction histidine kinase
MLVWGIGRVLSKSDIMVSLRKKIAFFTTLASLLALLAGVVATIILYQGRVHQQSARELGVAASTTPTKITAVGQSLHGMAKSLAKLPYLQNVLLEHNDKELFVRMANFGAANHIDLIEVTDDDGMVRVNLEDTLRHNQRSRNPAIDGCLNGKSDECALYNLNDQSYLTANTPIYADSTILGTITVGYLLSGELLQRINNSPGVEIAFWSDPEKPALVPIGKSPLPPLNQLLNDKEREALRSGQVLNKDISLKDNTLQCTFGSIQTLSANQNYIFVNFRYMDYLFRAGQLVLIPMIAISLLIMLIMMHFSWWVSKKLSEPLEELTRVTKEMGQLHFDHPLRVKGFQETAELVESFNILSRTLNETITQKDNYAEELRVLNQDLEHIVAQRTEELEHSNLKLNKEIIENDEFLRTVSHDMGAPLRNIAGLTKILEKKIKPLIDEDCKDKLTRIRNNAIFQLEMIDQLLELSRLKTRRSRWEEVDLMLTLRDIKQDFSYVLDEKNIHISISSILPCLFVEKDRIQRIFMNLIDNAIKYIGTQNKPFIEIGWSEDSDNHMFWIKDNGMGIPHDQQSRIFGIFQRGKNRDVSNIEGKGVGLASVKAIVQIYGGDIWVESVLNQGSTFYFTLSKKIVDTIKDWRVINSSDPITPLADIYEANTHR